MPVASCPPAEVLETLAVGGVTPPPLAAHLQECEVCRSTLQRIRADNRFLSRFLTRTDRAAREPAPPPAVIDIPGYQILDEIHRGGQGVVYRAVQRATRRPVAIKVMKHGPFATLSDRARFDREIDTLGRLNHPNIVAVHDAGVAAGYVYFVMNYVAGRPLDEALTALPPAAGGSAAAGGAAGPTDPRRRVRAILELFIKVCDAVQAAHLRGIIHRDLKPSNIRVDPQGEPHVLDFGLAKSTDAEPDSAMTQTGQFVGSLPWASPEQVAGESVKIDLRTDVYSLGAILFQLLTGHLPFDLGSNLRQAVDTILFRAPPRPSARITATGGPPLDDELDTIVLKCLAKDRERRYQTAGELAHDLRRYLVGEAIEAKRDSAIYMLRKTLRRYRLQVVVATAFVVLVTAFGAVMAVMYQQAARMQQAAVQTAGVLNDLLSQGSVEQGRMAGMLGNMEQAEQLLWRELLTHRELSGPHTLHLNTPPGPPEAYWGLWELYRRYPCRRTITLDPPGVRAATLSTDRQSLWTIDTEGRVQQLDEFGTQLDSYALPVPCGHALPTIGATGHFIVRFDGQRYAVYRRGAGEIPALELPVGATVICLSPSGQHVAAALDDTAVVWNLNPVAELARLRCDGGELTALALSHTNGRLAARDRLGGLHVWELASQQRVAHATGTATPRVATQSLGELLFSPDDRRLADAWMATPGRIWDLTTMPPTAIEFAERPGDYRVQGFSPDGGLLAIGDLRGAVRLFDTTTGQCRATFVAHPGRVRTVAFTADGQHIWTNGEGALRLWEVNAHAGVRIVRIAGEALHSVDISPAGDWLCAGGGLGKLYRIDATTLAVNTLDFGNEATVPCTAISPDGRWTAAATYASAVYVWDNQDPGAAPVQLAHGSLVSDVSFSPDSATLATACNDGILRIWRVAGGTLERELPPAGDRIPHLAFDATGQRLAIALRNGALLVWNLNSDTSETWKPPTQKPLRTVSFSPDGRWLLAAGADRIIEIWDTSTRQQVGTLVGHTQEIFCLDISPDGETIASGDTSGAIRLWHLPLRRPLAALEGHTAPVMTLHFAADGRTLVSASLDGTLRVWDLTYYAQHIAGNLETQLRRVGAEPANPDELAAWRHWAAQAPGVGQR